MKAKKGQKGGDSGAKPASKSPGQSDTTTVSTRFDESELRLLKDAAEKRRWSLAQFVRIAAKEKAANIVNSSGAAVVAVNQVLSAVVDQLISPNIHGLDRENTDSYGNPRIVSVEEVSEATGDRFDVEVVGLDHQRFGEFVLVVRRLGSELADLLNAAWEMSRGSDSYSLSALIDPEAPTYDGSPADESPVDHGSEE